MHPCTGDNKPACRVTTQTEDGDSSVSHLLSSPGCPPCSYLSCHRFIMTHKKSDASLNSIRDLQGSCLLVKLSAMLLAHYMLILPLANVSSSPCSFYHPHRQPDLVVSATTVSAPASVTNIQCCSLTRGNLSVIWFLLHMRCSRATTRLDQSCGGQSGSGPD